MEKHNTILISGDFCPINRIEQLALSGKHEEIFGDSLSVIREADFSIVNLECPLTNISSPIPKTGPNLMAREECIDSLRYACFDLVTLANNHISDHGLTGLKQTLTLCANNQIDVVGAGLSKTQATAVYYRQMNGLKVAVLSFADNEWYTIADNDWGANSLNPVSNFYAIREAKEKADYVIVIVHGGHEQYHLPSPRIQALYRFFVDAGADVVVGHHSHCISGYELYGNKPIFYSLGNFVFDTRKWLSAWNCGMLLLLTIDQRKHTGFRLIPFYQGTESPGIRLLSVDERETFDKKTGELNRIIADTTRLEKEFVRYCESVSKSYSYYLEPYVSLFLNSLRTRDLFPSLWGKKKLLLLKNLVRCESHREVLLEEISRKIHNLSNQ